MKNKVVLALIMFKMPWLIMEAAPAPPFSLDIDCSPNASKTSLGRSSTSSLCDCLQRALPQAITNGRIILSGNQHRLGGSHTVNVILPYNKARPGRLRTPVDQNASSEELDSAEQLELFQKGIERLMHVVSVFDKVDQYLSDRTRIIVNKLAKVVED